MERELAAMVAVAKEEEPSRAAVACRKSAMAASAVDPCGLFTAHADMSVVSSNGSIRFAKCCTCAASDATLRAKDSAACKMFSGVAGFCVLIHSLHAGWSVESHQHSGPVAGRHARRRVIGRAQ